MSDNPYDRLQEAADKILLEQRAAERLSQQRTRFLMAREPRGQFFASLALSLTMEPDWSLETGATDGKRIVYNPKFVDSLKDNELEGFLAHEVLHLANAHHARRGARDLSDWNTACDLAVNPLLREASFTLPPSGCFPGMAPFADLPVNLSAEEYYDLLKKKGGGGQKRPGGNGQGPGQGEGDGQADGDPDPGKCGGVKDPGKGSPAECEQAEAEARITVAQAEQAARRKGNLPAGLQRMIDALVRPAVPWQEILREFLTSKIRQDSNWSRPNRRFIATGLYLPTLSTEALGEILLAIDTSGSIGQQELNLMATEIQSICEMCPSKVTIIYHDAEICHSQTWEPQDGDLVLEPKGGGGTSHLPVFDYLAGMEEQPACLVCLTDLCSTFPASAPEVPVLWATVGAGGRQGPFGQTVMIDGE